MKKILYTSVFAACAAMGLSSCMNGDYDANPATTVSGTNPLLNTGGGGGGGGSNVGVAAKNEIRFALDGNGTTYSGAPGTNYIEVGSGTRLISGGTNTGTEQRSINLRIEGYTGPGDYTTGTGAVATRGVYTVMPFGGGGTKEYNTATGTPVGSGQIHVSSDANNEMIGTFSFTAYTSAGDKVTISSGSFDVVKN